MSRTDLVPVGENAEEALGRVLEAFGRSGVTLAECLDGESAALCASDLQYFDEKYYGSVPSYAVFVQYLNKLPPDIRDQFNENVAEIESGRTVSEMSGIASGYHDVDKAEKDRFTMLGKLNNIYEKRIDRIDRRRKDRGDGVEKGVDLAARLIAALSNSDLVKVKTQAETIDAEYKEVAENDGD